MDRGGPVWLDATDRRHTRARAGPRSLELRPSSLALIHPSAWNRISANFAFWGFSEVGQEFIGNSSPLASGGAWINLRRGLRVPPLREEAANVPRSKRSLLRRAD